VLGRALGGVNQKSMKKFCRGAHEELTAKKMARFHGSIASRKKEEAI